MARNYFSCFRGVQFAFNYCVSKCISRETKRKKKKVAEFLSVLFFLTLGGQKYLDKKELLSNEFQSDRD